MTDAVIINLPELPVQLLPTLSQFTVLRALPSILLANGQDYLVNGNDGVGDGGGGLFVWNAASTAADNDRSVIKPDDLGPMQAGRWILLADPSAQISGAVASEAAALAATTGSTLVGWLSRYASAIAGTVSDYFDDRCSVMHFIPFTERVKIRARTSTADLSAYFQSAAATGDEVFVPAGLYNIGGFTCSTTKTVFVGSGQGTVLREMNPGTNWITRAADYVGFTDMRLEGRSTSQSAKVFALYHDGVTSAKYNIFERLTFSGVNSGAGFVSCIKADTGADYPTFRDIIIDHPWGTDDGYGYGILCGAITGPYFDNIHGFCDVNRGRHIVYLSAGCSHAMGGNIFVHESQFEAVTINTHADQPTSRMNVLKNIHAYGCATAAPSFSEPLNLGSVSIFGNSQDNDLEVYVWQSVGVGFKIDGTGVSGTTACARNTIRGCISNSSLIGLDLVACKDTKIDCDVYESSTLSVGTYTNIRFKSDNVTAVDGVLMSNVWSGGKNHFRSALDLDPTTPVPTNLKIDSNRLDTGTTAQIEFNGVVCPINGRIEFAVGGFNRPAIAGGSAFNPVSAFSVPGAEVGDIVTVSHQVTNTDGCAYFATVTSTDNVSLSILYNGAGSSTSQTGNLRFDVWKRP